MTHAEMQGSSARHRRLLLLALVVVVAAGLRAYQFRGFGGADDFAYSQLAHRVAEGGSIIGTYEGPAVFPLRVGIILPTAAAFRVFGVHEWSETAFPLLLSLLGVILAFFAARVFFGPTAGVLAAAIMALLPLDSFYATVLVPDLPAAFFLGAAVTLVVATLRRPPEGVLPRVAAGVGVGLLLGYSWLCKESVAYAAPFFLMLAVGSLWKAGGKHVPMWAGVAAGSLVVLLVEASVYRVYAGDWLFHLHEMERNYRQNANAFLVSGSGLMEGRDYLSAMVRRLVLDGPQFMLTNRQYGLLPLVGVIACLHAAVHRNRAFLVPGLWLLTLLLMFNFGSSSTRSYVPLVLSDRYLYPIALPSVVLTAGFLEKLFDRGAAAEPVLRRERLFWGTMLIALLLGVFALKNRANHRYNPDWNTDTREASAIVGPTDHVYADILTLHGLQFYWSFPDSTRTVNFEDMEPGSIPEKDAFVLVNDRYLEWLSRYKGWWPTKGDSWIMPDFLRTPPDSWERVWSGLSTTLYRVR